VREGEEDARGYKRTEEDKKRIKEDEDTDD
jgi:hypothetical protein